MVVIVTAVVVTGTVVGTAVNVGGTVWMVVGAAGALDVCVHPAMHTATSRIIVRNKIDFLLIITFTPFFYILIIVMDFPGSISERESENRVREKLKKITAFLSP